MRIEVPFPVVHVLPSRSYAHHTHAHLAAPTCAMTTIEYLAAHQAAMEAAIAVVMEAAIQERADEPIRFMAQRLCLREGLFATEGRMGELEELFTELTNKAMSAKHFTRAAGAAAPADGAAHASRVELEPFFAKCLAEMQEARDLMMIEAARSSLPSVPFYVKHTPTGRFWVAADDGRVVLGSADSVSPLVFVLTGRGSLCVAAGHFSGLCIGGTGQRVDEGNHTHGSQANLVPTHDAGVCYLLSSSPTGGMMHISGSRTLLNGGGKADAGEGTGIILYPKHADAERVHMCHEPAAVRSFYVRHTSSRKLWRATAGGDRVELGPADARPTALLFELDEVGRLLVKRPTKLAGLCLGAGAPRGKEEGPGFLTRLVAMDAPEAVRGVRMHGSGLVRADAPHLARAHGEKRAMALLQARGQLDPNTGTPIILYPAETQANYRSYHHVEYDHEEDLSVALSHGGTAGLRRTALEAFLKVDMAHRDDAAKFVGEARALVSGAPREAALGINHFMKVDDAQVYRGLAEGLPAIEREFSTHGTEEDKECLHYVLHCKAGSSEKTFQQGLRRDEGRRGDEDLQFFVQHEHSRGARLTMAHVVALRVYTTAACQWLRFEPVEPVVRPWLVHLRVLESQHGRPLA